MKQHKSVWIAFALLVVVASVYRVWDGRPFGFAPQIAMALFGGAVLKDKKLAFILPLLSMFLSDALYEVLYVNGLSQIKGFYSGQVTNYLLFGCITFIGFWARNLHMGRIAVASLAAPVVYFLMSNFAVWASNSGYQRPKTVSGLMMAYADGVPFFGASVAATVIFSVLFFGSYYLLNKTTVEHGHQLA